VFINLQNLLLMTYNIIQRINIFTTCAFIFSTCINTAISQTAYKDSNKLKVIASIDLYREAAKNDSNMQMINLQKVIPKIVLDLRYETINNFMQRIMYTEKPTYTFLRLPAANALINVQRELNKMGYGLKIFDAYRPYFVTEKFWELVHDDRYVADPKKGSGHNRGIAVDLTIINLATNQELKMPTGFDNFTDSAHQDFTNLPEEILLNRKLLKQTMEKFGFNSFATEWWHYSLPNPEKYDVLDLSFNQLKKAAE
jgi:zinc D-Ala-D-Ala dipeptidase